MRQRPISVLIFGILNIAFAAFGFLVLLLQCFLPRVSTPVLKALYDNPSYMVWMKISLWLGGAAAVVLLVAGIGLLLLQNWARITSIGYGIYSILECLVGCFVMLNVFAAILQQAQGELHAVMIGSMVGSVFGLVIGLIYPILLIIFMTRPKVIAAFTPLPPAA
jgi:hypothetical protein